MNTDKKTKILQSRVLTNNAFDPNTHEFNESFRPYDPNEPLSVHTTSELIHCLSQNPNIELDARVLGFKEGQKTSKTISKNKFLESFTKDVWSKIKFRESDFFGTDSGSYFGIGTDFTPLLGGPFYKNLYYYEDYIRMHAEAFYAYHHDPVARAIVQITRDFVLGTGYEIQCDTSTQAGKLAMVAWKSFEEANDFQEQTDQFVVESSVYGESMFWELPNNQTKIIYQLGSGETVPQGIIPRVRLIDPSNIVEIVTYPEDITRPLFYVWLTPTQYQIYTSGIGSNQTSSEPIQPTLKFIYRQIPAEQMMHFKINSVSNEKRGRSDLFPVFSYLKRLRDSVNYSLVALQKTSAWSIDTTIDGDQTDIDTYTANQQAIGTIPPAGSEFVHSKAITRQYLGNSKAMSNTSNAFEWCLSMVAAGVGIPISYFGTHLSGGQTRASALVATEPVAKKMEKRREMVKRMLRKMWTLVMKRAGLPSIDCDIIFPEIITQDRSQKLKDILLMQQSRWIKPERAASLAAKEMMIHNYNYQQEIKDMDQQLPQVPMPLLNPGKISPNGQMQTSPEQENPDVTALTSQDKKDIKDDDTEL